MSAITLRSAEARDRETIVAFNAALALETERLELVPEVLKAGVAAVLGDPSKGFYLVAERGGRIVGQLMITLEWSDWRNGNWWWIQSVYVAPDARRQGVFRALFEEIAARARREGARGLRLYVERENQRAQATYSALGMKYARYELYELGDE
jgi:GNAT superfamily N-acetyltransferase